MNVEDKKKEAQLHTHICIPGIAIIIDMDPSYRLIALRSIVLS